MAHDIRENICCILRSVLNRRDDGRETVLPLISLHEVDESSDLVVGETGSSLVVEVRKFFQAPLVSQVEGKVFIGFSIVCIPELISALVTFSEIFNYVLMKFEAGIRFYRLFSVVLQKLGRILGIGIPGHGTCHQYTCVKAHCTIKFLI